jgi:hypothetical protein
MLLKVVVVGLALVLLFLLAQLLTGPRPIL